MKIQKKVCFIALLFLIFLNSDQGVPMNPKRIMSFLSGPLDGSLLVGLLWRLDL